MRTGINIVDNRQEFEPSRAECEIAAWHYAIGSNPIAYYATIRDLMLAGFCMLIMIGCNHEPSAETKARAAELSSGFRKQAEAITAKQDESLTILRENTAALQAIKSLSDKQMELDTEIVSLLKASLSTADLNRKDGDPAAPEPQGTERKSQTTPLLSDSPPAVRLFVTQADFPCAPCERMRRAIEAGEFSEFEIVWTAPFDGQQGFPATRFRSRTSPTGWRVIYGFDDSTIAQIKANIDGTARSEVMTGPLTGAFFQYPKDSAILSQRSDLRSDNRSDRRRRRPVNSAFSWLIPSAANQW
jgi:hypothetical protein